MLFRNEDPFLFADTFDRTILFLFLFLHSNFFISIQLHVIKD